MINRNAIIMAAGTASRFVPLSAEIPKGLLEVKGEVLIERQINQLHEAGIDDITIVVGYKADMFKYLRDKYKVDIVLNEDYYRFNNASSVIRVINRLSNTFLCSSDNYFPINVFLEKTSYSYYSALYAPGYTEEYCLTTDVNDDIVSVSVGGRNSWYMIGHAYFTEEFSSAFRRLLLVEYDNEATRHEYWEDVYIRYIDTLPKLKIHRYQDQEIEEFDSLDELRNFDDSYIENTRSSVLKHICRKIGCSESDLFGFTRISHKGNYLLFSFRKLDTTYCFNSLDDTITRL